MDKNVDQCSAVECKAAHPCLTKSPKEAEKSLYVFFFSFDASINIGREIWSLPYAEFCFMIKAYARSCKVCSSCYSLELRINTWPSCENSLWYI